MKRDEPGLRELLGPSADAAEVTGISEGENDEALGRGSVRGERHRFLADHLSVTEAAVDEKRGLAVDDYLGVPIGDDHAVASPIDIFADAHHAMGIVTDEIGLDQMMGDGAGLRLVRSCSAENGGREVVQGLGCIALRCFLRRLGHETPAIFRVAIMFGRRWMPAPRRGCGGPVRRRCRSLRSCFAPKRCPCLRCRRRCRGRPRCARRAGRGLC